MATSFDYAAASDYPSQFREAVIKFDQALLVDLCRATGLPASNLFTCLGTVLLSALRRVRLPVAQNGLGFRSLCRRGSRLVRGRGLGDTSTACRLALLWQQIAFPRLPSPIRRGPRLKQADRREGGARLGVSVHESGATPKYARA